MVAIQELLNRKNCGQQMPVLKGEKGHFIHDGLLGHVPNPGFCGSGFGGSFHTIDADGFRFCGDGHVSSEGSIVAVGDSYTYGDEVRDEESWPAQSQRLPGRRVLNGGVTGYGFDQIVLRAEQLADTHKPSIMIVSFIAEDIERTEMRRLWWRDKPWFGIENGLLVLRGVPVPDRPRLPHRIRECESSESCSKSRPLCSTCWAIMFGFIPPGSVYR